MISDLSWATSSNREDQPYEEWNTKTIHPTELLTFLPSTLVTIQWSHWALLDFFLDGASGSTMAKKCFLVDLNISVKNITYQWCKICPFLPPKTVNWEVPMCHSKQVCLQEPESDAKDTQPLHVIKHQTIFQIQLMIIVSQKYYLMPKGPRLIIISPSLKKKLDKLQQDTTWSLCLGAAILRSSGMAAFWKDFFNFTPSTPFFVGAFPLHISIEDTKIKKSISSNSYRGVDSQNTVR